LNEPLLPPPEGENSAAGLQSRENEPIKT